MNQNRITPLIQNLLKEERARVLGEVIEILSSRIDLYKADGFRATGAARAMHLNSAYEMERVMREIKALVRE